jgi:hypothetical protein
VGDAESVVVGSGWGNDRLIVWGEQSESPNASACVEVQRGAAWGSVGAVGRYVGVFGDCVQTTGMGRAEPLAMPPWRRRGGHLTAPAFSARLNTRESSDIK